MTGNVTLPPDDHDITSLINVRAQAWNAVRIMGDDEHEQDVPPCPRLSTDPNGEQYCSLAARNIAWLIDLREQVWNAISIMGVNPNLPQPAEDVMADLLIAHAHKLRDENDRLRCLAAEMAEITNLLGET